MSLLAESMHIDDIQSILDALRNNYHSETSRNIDILLSRIDEHATTALVTTPPEKIKHKHTQEYINACLGPYHRVKTSSAKDDCGVCLDEYLCREGIRKLDCGHAFHKKCIDKWFISGSRTCPMCRYVVFDEKGNNKDNNQAT